MKTEHRNVGSGGASEFGALRWRTTLGLATWIVVTLAVAPPASAAVINVPADQPTIQAGIDAAASGDSVVVAPGVYEEILDLDGKTITVRSSGGAAVTTIDATNVPDPGTGKPVFLADSGEAGAVIEGFTITGGTGGRLSLGGGGGGIYAASASLVVRDCVFSGLAVSDIGGAIWADSSDLRLDQSSLVSNEKE